MWLGLKKIHELTSGGGYSLRITMTDFDQNSYAAVYDQFQVVMMMMRMMQKGLTPPDILCIFKSARDVSSNTDITCRLDQAVTMC